MTIAAHSVFGPPGTGKTTEVLRRMAELKDSGCDPKSIVFMSFTRVAANEALRRLGLKSSSNVCTMHAMCYRLLNLSKGLVVDVPKMKSFCEEMGIDMGFDAGDRTEYDHHMQTIQYARNAMIDIEEAHIRRGGEGAIGEVAMLACAYERWKEAYGLCDFDDMLTKVIDQRLYFNGEHMFIDEAQDLTPLQWAVADHFAMLKGMKTVHISGDPDQALYSFSGVDPMAMLKFEDRFDAQRHVLSQSWRVPTAVHALAQSVIRRVQTRADIQYLPKPEEGSVERYGEVDVSSVIDPSAHTMVLCRTNHTARSVARSLRDDGISFHWEGEGSSWKRDASMCLRVWAKLCSGRDITQKEKAVLDRVLTVEAKRAINAGNAGVYKKSWREVMALSDDAMEYITDHGEDALVNEPLIEVSTIHGAKGRECENVVLVTDLTEKVRVGMDDDPDTEARVFYVGATRSANRLVLIGGDNGYEI